MSNKNLLFLLAAILGLVLGYTLAQGKRYDEMTKILKEANDKLEATRKEFK